MRPPRYLFGVCDGRQQMLPSERTHCVRPSSQLRRRNPQRFAAGSFGRQFRRISRDPVHLRGRQGRQIRLVRISAPTWSIAARAAVHFRHGQGPCRERFGFPAGGSLPELHGAFLPQRLQSRPFDQGSRVSHMLKAVHAQRAGRPPTKPR
jgi:hypothetical protein